MNDKYLWKLQIYWCGDWRTIMESNDRRELARYAEQCADDVQLRIIDTTEEDVKANGRKRR